MTGNLDPDRNKIDKMRERYPTVKRPDRPLEHRFDTLLMIVSLAAALSVLLGLTIIVPGGGVAHTLSILLPAALAGTFSWFVNKAAFHRGAALAAAGHVSVYAMTLGWFFVFGTAVATIGFTGLSFDMVEARRLRKPIAEIADATRQLHDAGARQRDVAQIVEAIAADMRGKAACEASVGCISGRRGRGAQVAALEGLAAKIEQAAGAFAAGERTRDVTIEALTALIGEYEATLSAGGSSGQTRAKLLALHGKAQALLTELATATPIGLAKSLAGELRAFPATASQRGAIDLGAALRGHADRLEGLVRAYESGAAALSPFPEPAGITAGWQELDTTFPLALLVIGIEGVLMWCWLLTVRDLAALRDAAAQSDAATASDPPARPGPNGYRRGDGNQLIG